MNEIIKTQKLCKTFSNGGVQQHVLRNIDLSIYEGDFTVIMGASGAGKSTLLYALSGMDKPTLGDVTFAGKNITKGTPDELALFRRKNCGFVFQQTYLVDSMSVLDNVLAAALLVEKNKKAAGAKAREVLKSIARALINEPKLVFADEPTGALNSTTGKDVLDVLTKANDNGQSIVMVTHDITSARRGNRILYVKDGEIAGECDLGKYVSGDKERHLKLRDFLGGMGW